MSQSVRNLELFWMFRSASFSMFESQRGVKSSFESFSFVPMLDYRVPFGDLDGTVRHSSESRSQKVDRWRSGLLDDLTCLGHL